MFIDNLIHSPRTATDHADFFLGTVGKLIELFERYDEGRVSRLIERMQDQGRIPRIGDDDDYPTLLDLVTYLTVDDLRYLTDDPGVIIISRPVLELAEWRKLNDRLEEMIIEARSHGITYASLSKITGLSRSKLDQIVNDRNYN